MPSLLRRVRTTLSIHAHRRVRGMLDGEYASVFHGRSLEFDDVRPYVPGDEVKDVDWKATARLGSLMTRRYVASRKQTVVLVVDTGRAMAATAASGESKRDLAVLAAGTAGFVATRHGDLVALVAGDAESTSSLRPESTEAHLERLLTVIDQRTTLAAAPSDLGRQLSFVLRAFTRGRILVVITDDRLLDERERMLLRRLSVQHELLWITIGDADLMDAALAGRAMSDVDAVVGLPGFVRADARLRAEFDENVARSAAAMDDLLDSLAISSARVTRDADVVPAFLRLLSVHRYARRRSARR